jgi:transposase-like protein
VEGYPRTLSELEARSSTENACRDYLFQLRWPEGFACDRCGGRACWLASRGRVVCRGCRRHVSIAAGTTFQDTHKPLATRFRVTWLVTSQKTGASALNPQGVPGLGSYKTAWTWLHKLRRAMVRPGRERLSGRVEADESHVGGLEEGAHGRGTETRAVVAIAAEEDGKGIGRIRMRRIEDCSAKELHAFAKDAVEPGSRVHTDGREGYTGLENKGYGHKAAPVRNRKASKVLPRVHKAASLLKRWLMYYLDEFTFRFNRRTSRYRGKLFYRLIRNDVAADPAPYETLVRGPRGRRKRSPDR